MIKTIIVATLLLMSSSLSAEIYDISELYPNDWIYQVKKYEADTNIPLSIRTTFYLGPNSIGFVAGDQNMFYSIGSFYPKGMEGMVSTVPEIPIWEMIIIGIIGIIGLNLKYREKIE